MFALYWAAFPDLSITLEHLLIDQNQAALFGTTRGVHLRHIMRIPPTGRAIQVNGASRVTVDHGQIITATNIWDVAGMLRNIGLLPALSPGARTPIDVPPSANRDSV